MRTGGIVLCGGRSSRMGRPKAWLPFGNELMLQRVVRVLCEVVEPVVVVAAPGQDVPELPAAVPIIRDEVEGKGPLGGLAPGLAALQGQADAAYLSSCDVPFLKPEFVRRVIDILSGGRQPTVTDPTVTDPTVTDPTVADVSRGADAHRSEAFEIAVGRLNDYFHPLAAVYRVSVLPHVRELLAADRLRPVFLFDRVPTRIIEPHELADIDPECISLRNLNTPEEYEAAMRELGERPA